MPLKLTLPEGTKIPDHIAIIPDGNRRWARARGLHTLKGHHTGFKRAVELGRAAREMGVHTVTLWGFSTENWDRSIKEVNYLMKLYVRLIDDYLEEARKDDVKLVHLGRKDRIPGFLLKKITQAEELTAKNKTHIVNLAIDYGGHDEIIRAVKQMIKEELPSEKVDKKIFEKYLDTHDQPYPYVDLLIRSSGEQRTSGLLLWQMEYAEMYWEEAHFPDFTPEKLREAILDYSRRRRRFGANDSVDHLAFKPQLTANLEVKWWRLSKIPTGTKFRDFAISHVKEQWGMSKSLAGQAAKLMIEAFVCGEGQKWIEAQKKLGEFYVLVRDEVKLAFEPNLAASLQVNLWQKINSVDPVSVADLEEASRKLVSEVYRISDFQATKAAHLMALASVERKLALSEGSELHWKRAEDYLEKYYVALKDRVA